MTWYWWLLAGSAALVLLCGPLLRLVATIGTMRTGPFTTPDGGETWIRWNSWLANRLQSAPDAFHALTLWNTIFVNQHCVAEGIPFDLLGHESYHQHQQWGWLGPLSAVLGAPPIVLGSMVLGVNGPIERPAYAREAALVQDAESNGATSQAWKACVLTINAGRPGATA